jgi:Tetratricopeptide repeat
MSSNKNIFKGFNHLFIYAVIIILFNLALLRLPLTKVFGFEFSVLNAVLISFLSGLFVISLFKVDSILEKKKRHFNKSFFAFFIVILIIPALISVVHSYLTIKCSLTDGAYFYLVITAPSVFIGGGLGAISYYFFRKVPVLAFIILYILILASPLIELYFNPQIYFYNPIFAYFPGTIYDESIRIDWRLISYRLFNFVFFGYSLYLIRGYILRSITLTNKFITVLIIAGAALFIYFSPDLNYSTTFNKLKSKLKAEVVTPHFNIYYSPELNKNLITAIALHHEYYYSILTQFFKDSTRKKIESFIFKDSNQKKELLGSKNADISKPWQYSVYITYEDYNNTLRHEIAHCFTAEFGTGPLRLAYLFNPALIEGAATAAAPFYDDNSIDYLASLAYQNNFTVKMKSLFSYLNFFKNVSSLSYIYAGSFSKYLINNYGIDKYKQLYATGDFQKTYDNKVDTLSKHYFAYLKSLDFANNSDKAYYYFGAKSIFYKVCPRFVANKLIEAWGNFNNHNYTEARTNFDDLLKVTDNYSAYLGLAESLNKLGENREAIDLLRQNINKFTNTSNYYYLEFYLADLLGENGDFKSADTLYTSLMKENPESVLYYLSELRFLLSKSDNKLADYIKGSDLDKSTILHELNSRGYVYSSIPALIDLAVKMNEDYLTFLGGFKKNLSVTNYESSYAVYRLSKFMIRNLDFERAKRMASLSQRYKKDKNFNAILELNYDMTNWMVSNSEKLINQFNFTP